MVVTFWGRPARRTPGAWIHQCGSVAEARSAHAAGADAVIVQGVEAGGHVRGDTPALELLERVRAALPADYPVLVAGGIAEREESAGRSQAEPSPPSPGPASCSRRRVAPIPPTRERLLDADATILTELFGAGWPAPHRVVPNAATRHWLGDDPRGPRLNRALNRLSAHGARFMPASLQIRLARAQRPTSRLLSPIGPTDDGFPTLVDAGPLYAGQHRRPDRRGQRRRRSSSSGLDSLRSLGGSQRAAGTTAMSSSANLPFASSGSPSG